MCDVDTWLIWPLPKCLCQSKLYLPQLYLKVYWHSELCRCICSYRYMTARVTMPSSVSPAGMAIPQ